MTTASVDRAAQQEGWAASLVTSLFPGIRQQAPKKYAADVQFIYDWETAARGYTSLDPLNIRTGDFGSRHEARAGSETYIRKHPKILDALKKGDYTAATKALSGMGRVNIEGKAKMPSGINTSGSNAGTYKTDSPSTLSEIGSTITNLPGAAVGDAGSVASGVGSIFGNHIVLIILVVAVVLIISKK